MLKFLPAFGLSLAEDVGGQPLRLDGLSDHSEAVGRAGETLRILQSCDTPVDSCHTAHDEIALLEKFVKVPCQLAPELADELMSTLEHVKRSLGESADAPLALSHRDFHEKQFLIGETTSHLIDFDTLTMANPALDAGNFLAHIHLAELETGLNFSHLKGVFLDGYRAGANERPVEFIDAYIRSALLRLACIHSYTDRGNGVVASLIAAARG